jgi:hypothetical protein
MAKRREPDIDEATVLFEVVLPELCQRHAAVLERVGPSRRVELRLRTRAQRSWVVQGGPGPWVRRGQVESGSPDLVITMTPELVHAVVHGCELDLDAAIAAGQLELEGNLQFLSDLGIDLG